MKMADKISAPATPVLKPPAPAAGMSTFLTIFIFGLALIILLDQGLRNSLGEVVGYAFDPLIGFNHHIPIITLLITGLVMTSTTILIRHFFTNYVAQAENQKITGAFNKELRQARKDNNMYRMKKLMEMQPKILERSMEQTKTQFKLLPVSMLIIIPIFAWLAVFVGQLDTTHYSVPWTNEANLGTVYLMFPAWILVYTLVTIPVGQILSRGLRFYSFRKRLDVLKAQGK
jgi:uncharacterized membrane protein (DUF106 family)